MANSFYVDIEALNNYTIFLNSTINKLNEELHVLKKSTRQFAALQNDQVAVKAEAVVNDLIKIFEKFNSEIEQMNKKVREDYDLYMQYLKSFR